MVGWSAARHILELDWSRNPDTRVRPCNQRVPILKEAKKRNLFRVYDISESKGSEIAQHAALTVKRVEYDHFAVRLAQS
jgi:hypothetical protein